MTRRSTALHLNGISKRFGHVVAADSLDLVVPEGSLTVILGPSGSGKSTVLNLIAGLETLDDGTILLGATRIDSVAPGARDLAMVFQSYALYPHMSARQNMAFPLQSRGVRKPEIARRVAATAEMLGLTALLDRRPAQLSGGEQQRVALGRALIRAPAAFLLDEPLSNLDERLRVHTRREFARLHAQLGITTLFVTHSQTEAMALGDRLAVMEMGRIRQVGLPQAVYDWPADTFVADFLGVLPMNLCRVTREAGEGWERLVAPGLALDLPSAWQHASSGAKAEVTLGFRPERASIGPPSGGDFQGIVAAIEPQGADDVAAVEAELGRFAIRLPPNEPWRVGDAVGVTIEPGGIRLFDPESGRALARPTDPGTSRLPSSKDL